ncbi:glycosyltransferase family 4 protein [Salipiger sp. CCB-MM3]|uniref:glycosyltransferase family 4 protein n=1 Tax=Salipiger sp. CCB-MM3 TaxID=1792508 RepID=UPI000B1A4FED|nr:glycosyltransferase family 4 protein [Salipiger sp. CCB-MM3]
MDDADTLRDDYYREQAAAIHRIYGTLYPEGRNRYLLRRLDSPVGDAAGTKILARAVDKPETSEVAGFHVLDEAYMGTYEAGGSPEDGVAMTITAGIPHRPPQGEVAPVRTSPEFGNRSRLAQWLVWKSPVLFEQVKYYYEQRSLRFRPERHSFSPVKRATSHPFGSLTGPRDTSKSPSILIGFHWLETGGAEKLAFDSVNWALQAGFRVLIVADVPEVQRLASKLPDDPNVEFIRLDAYLPRWQLFDFLEALVRAENVRAMHIHHSTGLYDNLLRIKAAFPDLVVIDSTHIIEHENGGFPRTSGVWSNYIDYHHVISRELAAFYLDVFGQSQKVKLGRMLPPRSDAEPEIEPVFNLEAGQRTCRLAFIGRMVHQKRAPLVVDVMRRLQKWAKGQNINLHLDMVGTGAYLEIVRAMIGKEKLGAVVTLHPADADVPSILRKSDILLIPSSNEGLTLVGYEAIGNGAIPISTDVGGQDELIPEELLLPAEPRKCVRAAEALIVRLMTDSEFLEKCKSSVASKYHDLRRDPSAEDVLTSLYRDILEGSKTT